MRIGNSPLRNFSPSKSFLNLFWPPQRLSDLLFGYYETMPLQNLELFFGVGAVDDFFGHIYPVRFSSTAVYEAKTGKVCVFTL